jgi:hypothetical protein
VKANAAIRTCGASPPRPPNECPPRSRRTARKPRRLPQPRRLRELGLERRAVDAVFRACPVVAFPGYSRPLIRVADYNAFVAEHTYRGDKVRI